MKRLAMMLGIFTLLLFSFAHAQQRWERNYGGTGTDFGFSVQQTTDGGYIVAGIYDYLGSNTQVYLVKTNASGDTLWTRNYGGAGTDQGYTVQQTTDSGYIVVGTTTSYGYSNQVYLIKTNASGDTIWTRTYGGANWDVGNFVQQTTDGGYIVAGTTDSFGGSTQAYLIKTNASGDTLWTKTYGGTGEDYGPNVQKTTDGGYIVAGMSTSFGNAYQVYLIKTNATGDTIWTKTYGGAGDDYGYYVQQTTDTGYIVTGKANSFGNSDQAYLIKTNDLGGTLWTRTYGGPNTEYGYSVLQTQDLGYIVAGYTNSYGNGYQVYLMKSNASGDTLWTRTYGGAGEDRGYSIQQTTDRGYIIAGYTNSFGNGYQVYLIKTDSLGNSTGVEETAEVRGQRLEVRITAKPNPFTSFATLPGHEAERFSLYDISGRKVGVFRGDRVGEGLAPGVYFLKYQEMLKQVQHDEIVRIVKVR